MVGGAALGAITSAATGGDVGLGALTGAITGALFCEAGFVVPAVSGALGATTPLAQTLVAVGVHMAAGAVSGAINSAITGSDIGMGALTGAVGAGIGAVTGGALKYFGVGVDQFGYHLVARTVTGGIAGGVVSSIYGGNFWRGFGLGAGTAAAAFLFNDWSHFIEANCRAMPVSWNPETQQLEYVPPEEDKWDPVRNIIGKALAVEGILWGLEKAGYISPTTAAVISGAHLVYDIAAETSPRVEPINLESRNPTEWIRGGGN